MEAHLRGAFRNASSDTDRNEARKYLTLLPVPGQWERLTAAERNGPQDPEIQGFLSEEKAKLARKVRKKAEKSFRVRHLMQVLKAPRGPKEKGILRIFSLPYVFADPKVLEPLSRRYVLFVEPTMGVIWRHTWGRYFGRMDVPTFYGLGGSEDRAFLRTQSGVVPLPLAHADFLEERPPEPKPPFPRYDLVFNGTFDDPGRKRHQRMLELLTDPRLETKTAIFLGRGSESAVQAFRASVSRYGLNKRLSVHANVPRREVPKLLALCRLGVHLSLCENGCRAIYEFFREDLPCVASSAMAGTNMSIFNPETGLAVPDDELVDAILRVLSHRDRFNPRAWFLRESGSRVSSRKLNEYFKNAFLEMGMEWTEDIVALGSSGASRYVSKEDESRFAGDHQWIARTVGRGSSYGVRISP